VWITVLCGVVVLGAGLLARVAFSSADAAPGAAATPAPTSSAKQPDDPTGSAGRSPGVESPAIPSRTASPARAAAGAEIAARADIDVSPSAATVLRAGKVDGRTLVVLASLATADLLTLVDVPPGGSADAGELEMGVVDMDKVLGWLGVQSKLRPDRVVARREASVTCIELIYDTPEPAGLFPS